MKHEFITKWQKQLPESQRSEFELDVYKYLNQPEPELNHIERAYEEGKKIRHKNWGKCRWVKKHSETKGINQDKIIETTTDWNFRNYPEDWEIYIEPEATPSSQPELNPIEKAYHERIKIRIKEWPKDEYIQKHSETTSIGQYGIIDNFKIWSFTNHPEHWEIYIEPEATPSSQPEMTYAEKAKYIIENKLTHKDALVKNCFAYMRIRGITFFFCDENGKDMFAMDFPSLDLSEWIPFQPKFDRNRFEAMFRAVVETHEATIKALQELDAYYASKEGGNHEN